MRSRGGRRQWRQRMTAGVVVAGLALFGCGTEDGDDPEAPPPVEDGDGQDDAEDDQQGPDDGTNGDGTAEPDDGADEGEAGDDAAAGDTEDPEPIAEGGDTDPDEAEGESPGVDDDGGPLPQAVVDVRTASHDTFDRVVFELVSDGGTPGWFVEYDEPIAQGSGEEVEVEGGASLTVLINPVSLPPDLPDDVRTWEGDPIDGSEGGVVQQIVGGSVFEGYHQFFIGVDRERPFAVERLEDPPRVVIDLFAEED
ncbi:MAG: hypothetical protein ACLFS9_03300 [Nitriliruptoraceae bacterium]